MAFLFNQWLYLPIEVKNVTKYEKINRKMNLTNLVYVVIYDLNTTQ